MAASTQSIGPYQSVAEDLANVPCFVGASPNPYVGSNPVIEPQEILEKIPPEGIAIGDLIKSFSGRVGDKPGQMSKQEWIRLVKQLCDYGPDKRLRKRK